MTHPFKNTPLPLSNLLEIELFCPHFPKRKLLLIPNAQKNNLTTSQPTNYKPFDEITNHPIFQSNRTIGKLPCFVLLLSFCGWEQGSG